jgi:LIVCS family branched-chain amino acid:cation transporter
MENKKQIKATDVLFIGLALFATYFGAGNLIFPPMLGLQSGTGWGSGMIGMIASGVGLPVLAMIILGHCGSVQRISDHVHKNFYHIFVGMIMVLCCCVSIPRTAAVGIEMGLQGLWGGAPYLVSVVIYFLIAFFFAKDRGTALDKVGKILTPVMTVILFILVIKGFISPIGTPSAPTVDNAFLNSFLGGYSTGDVLVSFLMASLFFGTIREKGYEGASLRKVNFGAGIIAAVCLAVVYGGLFFMGACVSGEYSADSIGNADLLLNVIRSSGGQIALYGLCLSVILACLTTAIGQITAVADFFSEASHEKLPYRVLVIIVPVVTTIVASFGLDTIVSLTGAWFSFTYPIALVLMILGIFERKIPNDGAYKGAVWCTVVYAFLDLPAEYGVHIGFLDAILDKIPLYGLGFGWVVPAAAGFIVGLLAGNAKKNA